MARIVRVEVGRFEYPLVGEFKFFRTAARTALLGATAAVTATLVRRRQLAGQECINRGLCRGCAVFAQCGLPSALSAKQVLEVEP